jgi:signal peptidase I
MNFYPPTQQPTREWEGGAIPPLRMETRDQGASVAKPAGIILKGDSTRARPLWRQILALLVVGVLCVAAYFAISRYVITPVVIQGRSMAPTLRDGEYYFLNRWVYFVQSPQRRDLVVIRDPGHDDFAVKRIIAKPGDWLNLKDGTVFLNGQRLEEPYLPKGARTFPADLKEKWIQLGRDQYFVMGDNRSNSEDSRFYGRIRRSAILGQITN